MFAAPVATMLTSHGAPDLSRPGCDIPHSFPTLYIRYPTSMATVPQSLQPLSSDRVDHQPDDIRETANTEFHGEACGAFNVATRHE
jgi:hypothetical protein